jgi:hypothetical protein
MTGYQSAYGAADYPTAADRDRCDAYIKKKLAEAPPLTAEQRAKLAELLRPVRIKPPRAAPPR